eukprot:c8385_g1_i2.p1 GENE.c8385_g1_i2~~c8385_g1_i2.p1  ORF type:complete len:263 (+),score=68.53 c8385_g1_i2:282-1070(+)
MAGTVHEINSSSSPWKIGDRVMAILPGGGYAQYVSVHQNMLMPVPPGMNWEEAAAIPEVWMTAFQLLHVIGNVRSGEVVLIHAGASGVGTAATQLAAKAGATVIVTVGSDEKVAKAKELGATTAINYKSEQWAAVIQKEYPSGVNLILDCVGASYWQSNCDCLAMDGRWVVYGSMGGTKIDGNLLGHLLRKRITIVGSTLRARSVSYKIDLTEKFCANVLPLLASNTFSTVVDRVMSLEQVQEAHDIVESNQTIGKVILTVE